MTHVEKAKRKRRTKTRKWVKKAGGRQGIARALTRAGYPPEYTYRLRRSIRERDGFRCCRCGRTEDAEIRTTKRICLNVHHIDGNKKNCDRANLLSLCGDCHDFVIRGGGILAAEVRGWIITSPLYRRVG